MQGNKATLNGCGQHYLTSTMEINSISITVSKQFQKFFFKLCNPGLDFTYASYISSLVKSKKGTLLGVFKQYKHKAQFKLNFNSEKLNQDKDSRETSYSVSLNDICQSGSDCSLAAYQLLCLEPGLMQRFES